MTITMIFPLACQSMVTMAKVERSIIRERLNDGDKFGPERLA